MLLPTLTNRMLPMTAIKTYRDAYRAARILILRLRRLVVATMMKGAVRIIMNASSCKGEKVSPSKNQPRIR